MNKLAHSITAHNKSIIVFFAILSLAMSWFVQNFKIDASADTLLMKNNKLYIETQLINQRFSPEEFVLVAYEPKQAPLFSAQTFDDIQTLSAAFKQIDRVEAVTHILNVPLLSQLESLNGDIQPNDWTWLNQRYSVEKMQAIFDQHPLFTDLLINRSQTATALQIVFKPNKQLTDIDNQITQLKKNVLNGTLTKAEQAKIDQLKLQAEPLIEQLSLTRQQEIKRIYAIVADYQDHANVYLGGAHVLGFQLIDIIQSDLVIFGSGIGLTICLLLLVIFRQFIWLAIPVICCAVSVVITIGLFGLLDMRTTVISSNFVALQLILTLAIVIHLIVEFRQLANAQQNASQKSLVQQTFVNKLKPCFYAGLTTAVGFASLLFSGIQPVIAFGWMMIIAMLISILSSLILFPAIVSLFKRSRQNYTDSWFTHLINPLQKLGLQHSKKIIVVGMGVLLASIAGSAKLTVENSFINYFSQSTRAYQELSFIDREFGGTTALDVIYTIPPEQRSKDLALSAQSIQTLQKIQFAMQQLSGMGNTTSVVNFTQLAKNINQGMPLTEYELTVIYRLIDDALRSQLLGAYFSPEHNQLRISSRIQDSTDGLNRAEFIQTLKSDIAGLGVQTDNYQLGNLFVLYQDILQRLFTSQILTMGIVYIALYIVLIAIFRSLRLATIALIPNVLATLVILGIMGWLAIPLDLMTITIVAIAMGIAVDDTIHFVHRFQVEAKQQPNKQALKKTYSSIGFAMLYTSLIITLGFSLLSFSDFIPSVMFGLLTGLAMLVALLTDLTLLPALLFCFAQSSQQKKVLTQPDGAGK